jgi:hypothetical protein
MIGMKDVILELRRIDARLVCIRKPRPLPDPLSLARHARYPLGHGPCPKDHAASARHAPAHRAGAEPPPGVGSPVDPYRLGDTMSTRMIAIVALAIAVILVLVLFVL